MAPLVSGPTLRKNKHSDPGARAETDAGEVDAWRRQALVVVHFGRPGLTRRCLQSLAQVETVPHHAVVVDHSAEPGLAEVLAGIHPHLTVLADPGNPGYGPGCNRGARAALECGARALWFLNNDAVLERPLLAALLDYAERCPEVALWGTQQLDGDRRLGADRQPFACGAAGALGQPGLPPGCRLLGPRESLSGASLFLRKDAWERLGPWPEGFFVYLEDTAWCYRAHRAGLALAITDLAVVHRRSSTIGRHSRLGTFYGMRNRILLHREVAPRAWPGRLLMGLHALQKRFFQGRWRLLRPTFEGLLAGLRGQRGRDPRY